MEISVNNSHILIRREHQVTQFSTQFIRKTVQTALSYRHRKRNPRLARYMFFVLLVVSLSVGGAYADGERDLEDATYISLVLLLFSWIYWALNPNFKKKKVTLHYGTFVSGDNDRYSVVSQDRGVITGFMEALTKAMEQKISATYNISIDQSLKSENMTIDKIIARDRSRVSLVEGDVPSKN
ncbi:hypothetical protein [Roseospira visakhapatnamensis]|uniref:Uncharacterized protein n=1 Tax=Roseospira visakhapatnamensis TaxID=390880 RepID=A0A7W6RDC6_9PROT|nr:hypothetical protein [Roseospira visakhapatnamensis]MBB4265934.1 hypothetical protein [Roseospira visakhapatnamensis]